MFLLKNIQHFIPPHSEIKIKGIGTCSGVVQMEKRMREVQSAGSGV